MNYQVNYQTKPQMEIDIYQPRVEIDQQPGFDELGYKAPLSFSKSNSAKGKQVASQGIDRRVSEGRALQAFENGVRAAEITAKRSDGSKQINVDLWPKNRPVIEAITRDVDINYISDSVRVNLDPSDVSVESQRGNISTYLIQKPSVHFQTVGSMLDLVL